MTDLYHPLYWLGSAAFMLAGGLIGYSVGFRGGMRAAWGEALEVAAVWVETRGRTVGGAIDPTRTAEALRALKGGRP